MIVAESERTGLHSNTSIFLAGFAAFAFPFYAKAALIPALSVNSRNAATLPLRSVNTITNGESNVLPVALVLAR